MIGILDCNNFYASCERVFRPELLGKPIAVLSNNDGCIIARSQELKDLGIPMAAPLFKCRKTLEQHKVNIFSANFVLYGDLSQRVMQILKDELPKVEVYSIDEAFFDLSGMPVERAISLCHLIKVKIQQWLGLPVSIGIAENKTLAKLANHVAKKQSRYDGVYYLPSINQEPSLHSLSVSRLWGVGRNLSDSLLGLGIADIKKLHDTDLAWLRKKYSVVMEQTVRELRGEFCFPLQQEDEYRQNLCVARSFGKKVTSFVGLRAAVMNFTGIACEKLRAQNCLAKSITVYVRTNPFDEKQEQYRASRNVVVATPTQDTAVLMKAVLSGLKTIYKRGYTYKKAGVVISDILPQHIMQLNLFEQPQPEEANQQLSQALDKINHKYASSQQSRKVIQFAAVNLNDEWRMNQNHRTPRYTTSWRELKKIS